MHLDELWCFQFTMQHNLAGIQQFLNQKNLICIKRNYIIKIKQMFSLKISYKGKNILLGKGIDSLKKIDQQLAVRFPGEFIHGSLLKYQGSVVSQFDQIVAIAATSANKSLKLQAEQAEEKKLSVIVQEQKQQVSINSDIKVAEQKQQQQKHELKLEQDNLEQKKIIQIQDDYKVEQPEQQEIIVTSQQPNIHQKQQEIKQKIIQIQQPIIVGEINQKNQEVQIQTEYKPQIIKCQIFGEAPQQQINVEEVKCTIYNEVPKQMREQNLQQEKPQIIKSSIFNEIPIQLKQQKIMVSNELREIQNGVYECIFCQQFQKCNVCERTRKITQGSKFFKIVNKLVQKKLQEHQNKILQKISKMMSCQQKKIQKQIEIKKAESKLKIQQRLEDPQKTLLKNNPCQVQSIGWNKKQVSVEEKFHWTFKIKFRNPIQNPIKACILDEKSGQIKKINLSNESMVNVGPYEAPNEAKFDRTFRLGFLQQDQSLQLFGPKFGFSVAILKPQIKKTLSNAFRIHVQQIKKGYKVERSVQYLIQKLKQMGISQQNYEQSKELLVDIIQTV